MQMQRRAFPHAAPSLRLLHAFKFIMYRKRCASEQGPRAFVAETSTATYLHTQLSLLQVAIRERLSSIDSVDDGEESPDKASAMDHLCSA